MIVGVKTFSLNQIHDERGKIMNMLRNDDLHFKKFGEIYFSEIYPNVIKGWHYHEKMCLNYAVLKGMIKLVLFDHRKNSKSYGKFQEFFLSPENYKLVTIPKQIWNGFKCISETPALVANCSDIPHDPLEIKRVDPHESFIKYDWIRKDG